MRGKLFLVSALGAAAVLGGCGGSSNAADSARYVKWCAAINQIGSVKYLSDAAMETIEAELSTLKSSTPEDVKAETDSFIAAQQSAIDAIREKVRLEGDSIYGTWSDSMNRFGLQTTLVGLLGFDEAQATKAKQAADGLARAANKKCGGNFSGQ